MLTSTLTTPTRLLRIEGFALLAAAILLYALYCGSWWLFAALLLAPDLTFVTYLAGPRIGAAIYNLFHHQLLPLALAVIGLLVGQPLVLSIGLIWLAHIGMDHAAGYGFKYPDAFEHTYLSSKGPDRSRA